MKLHTFAYLYVAIVTPRPIIRKTIPRAKNKMPLPRANSGPTDDTLRQCGHLAKALFSVLNCGRWNKMMLIYNKHRAEIILKEKAIFRNNKRRKLRGRQIQFNINILKQ